jgi:hypothetical protein
MTWGLITVIILLITIFILVGLCIFFIYDDVTTKNTTISPSQCPKGITQFGVNVRSVGNIISTSCGTSGTDTCTFNNITSLGEAVDICNANINICSVFSYSPNAINDGQGNISGIMSIVTSAGGVSPSTSYDSYFLQIPSVLSSSSSSASAAA